MLHPKHQGNPTALNCGTFVDVFIYKLCQKMVEQGLEL